MSKETLHIPPSPEELYDEFFKKIEGIKSLSYTEKTLIEHAYHSSENAHRDQFRAGGEAYFEHPRAVALILIDECGVEDPDLIITALLHDTVEDTPLYADRNRQSFFDWKKSAQVILPRTYNRTVAKMVLTLSKPLTVGGDRDTQLKLYYTWLNDAIRERPKTILVKMADRLHNLRTLGSMPAEKQKRKMKETLDVYIPLFEKLLKVTTEKEETLKAQIEEMRQELQTVNGVINLKSINEEIVRTKIAELKPQITKMMEVKKENEQITLAGTYLLKQIKKIVL